MIGQLYHLGKPKAKARAQELLEKFELSDAANRKVKTYSGGMRRRLDLAATLIASPSILFLDEPTTGLDPRSRLGLWEVIAAQAKDCKTVFLTTQYLEEADRLANKIAIIDKGRILREGTNQELKDCCGGDTLVRVRIADRSEILKANNALKELGGDKLHSYPDTGEITLPSGGGTALLPEVVRRLDAEKIIDCRACFETTDSGRCFSVYHRAPSRRNNGVKRWLVKYSNIRYIMSMNISNNLSNAFSDIGIMTRRNMLRYIRLPQLLVFNALLNVVLLLLFNYVFGGAIRTGGIAYIQYFLPGFMVQTVVFGSTQTSVGLAEDLSKGMIDRFRSLPMSRPAFLTGRVVADTVRYAILIVLMIIVGSIMGFRFENGVLPVVAWCSTNNTLWYCPYLGGCFHRDICPRC